MSREPDDTLEPRRRSIDRLERKVEALATAVGVEFAGPCSHCEEGLLVFREEALVCSACSYTRPM